MGCLVEGEDIIIEPQKDTRQSVCISYIMRYNNGTILLFLIYLIGHHIR